MNIIYILLSIILIVVICGNTYVKLEKIKLERIKLYESVNFDSKYELLNRIIIEEVDDYKILNFAHREDEEYINTVAQKEMINIITANVFKRITSAIKENLKLIYNINSDEDLVIIIGRIVSRQVLEYVIDINVVKDDE